MSDAASVSAAPLTRAGTFLLCLYRCGLPLHLLNHVVQFDKDMTCEREAFVSACGECGVTDCFKEPCADCGDLLCDYCIDERGSDEDCTLDAGLLCNECKGARAEKEEEGPWVEDGLYFDWRNHYDTYADYIEARYE